jgi:hypothetical protein
MMNRLKDYVRFIHGFQVYRPSHVDSEDVPSNLPNSTRDEIGDVLDLDNSFRDRTDACRTFSRRYFGRM